MIEFKNVSKKYNNNLVLNNINLTLPRFGLIIINGPSGCGKTTLMNITSSLLDFEGDINFDGKSYSTLSKDEKDNLRNKKIGFVFQDYKLFEYESVKNNVLLAIDISCSDYESKKEKRVSDLLKLVGLYNKENEIVATLSGGEKQRVAIARALANSPSILIADEPTGNLDEANTKMIMELLVKISSSSLVLMVSHDLQISEEYADQIIKMKDGKIEKVFFRKRRKHSDHLPIVKLKYSNKRRKLPFKFLLSHTFNSISLRKWRTFFITTSTSLGLVGVGLATTLSDIVAKNLYRSYSSIVDTNKLVVSNKNDNYVKDELSSASYEEVNELFEDNKSDVSHIGVYYWNASYLFQDDNYLSLDIGGYSKSFGNFNSTSINEFRLLSTVTQTIYPNKIGSITNDEIIISIPNLVVEEICYQLQITRSLKSLSNYLEQHEVFVNFVFSNSSWSYSTEVRLRLRGFILSNEQLIYHSNPFWNEYIFENMCHLPSTEYINVSTLHPWDLIKSYYLEFIQSRDEFLINHRFSLENNDLDFELLDEKYYPLSFQNKESYEANRVMIIHRSNKDDLPSYIGEYSKVSTKNVNKVIYGSDSGYAIYGQSLMMGFSRFAYLAYKEEEILDVVDLMSYIKYEDSLNVGLPSNIAEGHFSKGGLSGFIFEPTYQIIKGREPVNYQEILISTSLADKLGMENPFNKVIYFSFPVKEELLANGYLYRDFKTVGLKVVGITSNPKMSISHNEAWSILFFQTMLGVSTFELRINNMALEINEGKENDVIDKLSRAFPFLEITAPLKDVEESVNRICGYIETIMLAISIASIIIAAFILFICNYLHYMEVKKDIGLVRCLGVKEKESRKFVYSHSLMMTMISFVLSSIELFALSFVLSKALANYLYIESIFVINPLSFVYMLLVALSISLFSSILISKKISKLDPLTCLR